MVSCNACNVLLPKFCDVWSDVWHQGREQTNAHSDKACGMNILTLNRASNREPNRYPGYSELTLYTSSHGGLP